MPSEIDVLNDAVRSVEWLLDDKDQYIRELEVKIDDLEARIEILEEERKILEEERKEA